MPKVSLDELVDFGVRLLAKHGFSDDDAGYIAETSATTEAAGIHTHGAVLLAAIDGQVGSAIDVKARPKIVSERGATALVDGNGAAGGVCMRLAVDLARKKAKEHGIAMIAVRNTSWVAALGAYVIPLAREGFFAQLWAQSSQCQDSTAPGGSDARFSTNPVALAFPTAGEPVVADFSTAVMSMGKVNTLAKAGKKASQPVFFTKAGELTDDPNAMIDGGAMLTAGGDLDGHKGYALTLWDEALTAMAGGSCNHPERQQRQCFNLTVIDSTAFGDAGYYRTEMARMIERIKASRKRPGVTEIRLPGERMFRQIAESKKSGVEIGAEMIEKLNGIAEKRGIEPLKVIG